MLKRIKSKWKRIFITGAGIVVLLLCAYLGGNIPFSSQFKMYEALRQTSILIFGLIGAWLAVLLPFSVEKENKLKTFFSFAKELFPALSAAIYLLIITLTIPFLAEIIKSSYKFDSGIICVFRTISMSIICLSTFLLIGGLINVLLSFDALKKEISMTMSKKDKETKFAPRSKKKKTNQGEE